MKHEFLIKILCTLLSGAGFAVTFSILSIQLLDSIGMAIAFIVPITILTLCAFFAEIVIHRLAKHEKEIINKLNVKPE
jgi:hypothetical protein